MSSKNYELLDLEEVKKLVGLARSSIYRQMLALTFPRCIHVGERTSRWVKSEIMEWIQLKMAERDNDIKNNLQLSTRNEKIVKNYKHTGKKVVEKDKAL